MNSPTMLVINTGSTSTKLALYRGEECLHSETIEHPPECLAECPLVTDQYPMRREAVLDFLRRTETKPEQLDIVMSRGGSTRPVEGGAYGVNDLMVDRLKNRPFVQHAGILGPVIAREIADLAGVRAYVYDSAATDELASIARISGMKEIRRASLVHTLNTRYTARQVAASLGRAYEDCNVIAAHMGGGITITLHAQGRLVDVVGDEEGPFSPERAGGVSSRMLVDLCFSGKYANAAEVHRIMRGRGGLASYLGTSDAREVERRIEKGDTEAELVYDAMIYQIAKGVASLAPVVDGYVDFIVFTGAIAHSKRIVGGLKKRLAFLAPIHVVPGDHEMEALHRGGLDIFAGHAAVKEYMETPD